MILENLYTYFGHTLHPGDHDATNAFATPRCLRDVLARDLHVPANRIYVTGPIEDRLIIVRLTYSHAVLGYFGRDPPTEHHRLRHFFADAVIHCFGIITARCIDTLWDYLAAPRVFLAALYHPEYFPLPRFSLAISDLARSLRLEHVSEVFLCDMQLGLDVTDVHTALTGFNPDVIGISATFGQHDILQSLMELLDPLYLSDRTIVFGGSLCSLNQQLLLDRWPQAFVATGPGEQTIRGIVRWWRGETSREAIPGVAYQDAGRRRLTAGTTGRKNSEMLPELDLLADTLAHLGVVQLESSRGCSYACSFCPREHKGIWAGDDPAAMETILPDISTIFSAHPYIKRKVFLVDEEFIGYRSDDEAEARARGVASKLASHRMTFETSSRADQIYRPHKSPDWHVKRLQLWRDLMALGLERCLFGIESGVESVLHRFNKKTSSYQNVVAIRLISLLGIPPRFTYITFDQLMTLDELQRTYWFQGRTDLLLAPQPDRPFIELLQIATSDELALQYAVNRPFYQQISYMLVSMEPLLNAPYTSSLSEHGLLTDLNPYMGRFDAIYAQKDIGCFSLASQLWIDRTFRLDYLLKSIEKYSVSKVATVVRELRQIIKWKSYELLGYFLFFSEGDNVYLPSSLDTSELDDIQQLRHNWNVLRCNASLSESVPTMLLDWHFAALRRIVMGASGDLRSVLPTSERQRIDDELEMWSSQTTWRLINPKVKD